MAISSTYTTSLVALALTFTCGCMGDRGVAPVVAAPEHTLGRIITTPTVALMAVGGTGQLRVTGYSLTGDSVALDSVVYQLDAITDSVRVRLDSTGAIAALNPTSRTVQVNVFGFKGDVVQADRVMLQVTPQAISGLTLSIQPGPSDSAIVSVGTGTTIMPILRNPLTGAQVSNPAMRYRVKSTCRRLRSFTR